MRSEDYMPRMAQIADIVSETQTEKTFTLQLPEDDEGMHFTPGQFVEVSVFGAGEAPFGLASSPAKSHVFECTVRRYPSGIVTVPLHRMEVGDYVGVRGPLGNGFPLDRTEGLDMIIIGGGLGLPTLRAALLYILDYRYKYGDVTLLYGARTPQDRLYKDDLRQWTESSELECRQTVDVADESWDGNVGYVTEIIEDMALRPKHTSVIMCGPAVMISPCVDLLEDKGVTAEQMWINMEAHMKCGVGKCGHCLIKDKYVCLDGPVFRYDQVREMEQFQDAI